MLIVLSTGDGTVSGVCVAKWLMSALDPLRTMAARGSVVPMRLKSIIANRHIIDGEVNGKPVRLLLNFEGGNALRLQVAGDVSR